MLVGEAAHSYLRSLPEIRIRATAIRSVQQPYPHPLSRDREPSGSDDPGPLDISGNPVRDGNDGLAMVS